MDDNYERPELPKDRDATGDEIDVRLKHTDRELDDIRDDIAKVRESMRASLDGNNQRAAEILDELDADEGDDS